MKTVSFLKIAAVAALMLVGVSVAAPAQAATGNWNSTANGPTMYQTNYAYYSTWMSPPISVPSTAWMTSIYWNSNFSWYPSGLTAYFMTELNGYAQLPSLTGSSAIAPLAAKQSIRFGFVDYASQTYTYSSQSLPNPIGGGHQLNINYQY